ncbi:hypothetical protein [Vibrio profundi]|uniref:hypothetical protein n=1 Tax=Vibrio profundi TaxID=1774960 RepID=UPI0037357515
MKASDSIQLPSPDMLSMVAPKLELSERSIYLLEKLREEHGLAKPSKRRARLMNYVCTNNACMGL